LFALLKTITDYPFEPQYAPARVGETFKIYLDASRAARELGWQPTRTLEEGLRETVAYFAQELPKQTPS